MRTLSRDRYETGLATLRRIAAEGEGFLLAEIDCPAIELNADAIRIASLYVQGSLGMGDVTRLVGIARDIRGRLVMDREGADHTIRITISRVLDTSEEAALAARMQERARLGGAA